MRWAVARGARSFDFGRSPRDGGTYRFKRGWGAQEEPLAWVRLGPEGTPRAMQASGENAWMTRLSQFWTKLPVGLASRLGPPIRRRLAN
jgi:hypothetical protein